MVEILNDCQHVWRFGILLECTRAHALRKFIDPHRIHSTPAVLLIVGSLPPDDESFQSRELEYSPDFFALGHIFTFFEIYYITIGSAANHRLFRLQQGTYLNFGVTGT